MSDARTVTVNGQEVEIPPEIIAQTKFTKLGAVDKRADHSAFDAWLGTICQECGQASGHYDDCPVGITGPVVNGDDSREPEDVIEEQNAPKPDYAASQALLERIWAGQANDLKPEVRRARIVSALQDKGLPTDKLDWPYERPAPVKPGEPAKAPDRVMSESELQIAQAYALKVWHGQEFSLGRSERVARVRRALEGQGLSMHGVELPRV